MLDIEIINWKQAIATAKSDPIAGIKIAHLSGDGLFSLYVTSIPSKQYVNPHYHEAGIEIYQIVEGAGLLHLAIPGKQRQYIDRRTLSVKTGDCFTIYPNTLHQLENNTSAPLALIFGCPNTHLSTDRIIWGNLIE